MQRLRYSRYFKFAIFAMDIATVCGIYLLAERRYGQQYLSENNLLFSLLLVLLWVLVSGRTKLYSIPRNLTYTLYIERLISHMAVFLFGTALLAKINRNGILLAHLYLVFCSLVVVFFTVKSMIFFGLKYLRLLGINYRNIMFYGDSPALQVLRNTVAGRRDYGFRIHTLTGDSAPGALQEFWQQHGIHTMFVATGEISSEKVSEILHVAEIMKVKVSLVPELQQSEFFEYDLGYIETQPVLSQTKFPLEFLSNALLKRAADVFFSLLFLMFIGVWLFPLLAVLIKINSRGPVFFLQKRYGYHEQVFSCIKFRSMVVNGGSSTEVTAENDARITKIGTFLRATSLDETPQFINVLLGQMSIVGPRPHMLVVDDYYRPKIRKYSARSSVKPGITGLAQVSGYRGDRGDMEIGMQKRILADYFYVKNWSLSLDGVIMLKTVLLLVRGDKKPSV